MKKFIKIAACFFALAVIAGSLISCSQPPELEAVKDTFVALIEASVEVNNIFFGEGLPTYPRTQGDGNLLYDEASKAYYMFIADGDRTIVKYKLEESDWAYALKTAEVMDMEALYRDDEGYFYYPIDYTEEEVEYIYYDDAPENYDYVRVDCEYQSVEDIMALAESVYSKAYLKGEDWEEGDLGYGGVYAAMFDGIALGTEISYARYSNDNSVDGYYLLKSNEFEPYFTEHKTYNYDTMKIVSPSRANLVNIEITANGRYIDYDNFEVKTGEHTVTLTFVFENGEWRLDTPTY